MSTAHAYDTAPAMMTVAEVAAILALPLNTVYDLGQWGTKI